VVLRISEGNHMKRVLLLVCLFVSLVELDLERDRIFLMSLLASLLFVFWNELLHRRKAQQAGISGALSAEDAASSQACLPCLLHPDDKACQIDMIEHGFSALQKVTIVRDNSG
jgi:hypothetical protein